MEKIKPSPFRWRQLGLTLDFRIHQLTRRVGKKRFGDAKMDTQDNHNSYAPPWLVPLDDPRYIFQRGDGGVIDFFKKTIYSPEWMIAVTARQIAKEPSRLGIHEYKLTGSVEENSKVPEGLGELEYLWWRLEYYFDITQRRPALFTDKLLTFALTMAKLMWDSSESPNCLKRSE